MPLTRGHQYLIFIDVGLLLNNSKVDKLMKPGFITIKRYFAFITCFLLKDLNLFGTCFCQQ
jgi:hypothetical protein